jgi:uncharacterized RDD family membrane protein YckC
MENQLKPGELNTENQRDAFNSEFFQEIEYAGFWSRLGALIIDGLISIPLILLVMYLNGRGKEFNYYTLCLNLVFTLWYFVYLPKRYGGTPGKLSLGLRITREDGQPIQWKEAFLRYSVLLAFQLSNSMVMFFSIMQADDATFASLGWMKRTAYLASFYPEYFKLYQWCSGAWYIVGIIVLVANSKCRAVHDFIAGTVVIKNE